MPSTSVADLNSLLRSTSIVDDEELLKACNAKIKADKSDLKAQHFRVVALLKLDRFDDALRAIAEGGATLESACTLEKAYALYKTGQLDEANEALKAAGEDKRGFRHVRAQVAYRAEKYDQAKDCYESLLQAGETEENNDIGINLAAVAAQAEWTGTHLSGSAAKDQQYESFELCYNAACACIAKGAFRDAERLLRSASMLCDSSDELSEDEKQSEMRPIVAQQAYVYTMQGREKEALELWRKLGDIDETDLDVYIITGNNQAVTEAGTINPYVVQRRMASRVVSEKQAKLFKYQADMLAHNVNVVDLAAHKAAGVRHRTASLLRTSQEGTTAAALTSASAVNAAAETSGLRGDEVERRLLALSQRRPYDVGLILTIVQLRAEKGDVGSALHLLESLLQRLENAEQESTKASRFCPGLVGLTVSLMRMQGRQASAKHELRKASRHWLDRPLGAAKSGLREAGIELLRSSNISDLRLASSAFEKLLASDPSSEIAAAGLVASVAPYDVVKVEDHITDLPQIHSITQDVDVTKLLEAGVVSIHTTHTTLAKRPLQDEGSERSNKKRRKRKLPQNYTEGKVPDPERWLPLRDRSTYRPKGKKGKKKAVESTQGGIVKEETLDLVGGGGVKVEKAAASGSTSKKKKKGKK